MSRPRTSSFQKSLGMPLALYAKAQVTSGTGRVKRSSRFTRSGWRVADNRWKAVVPLREQQPRIEETLVDSFLTGGTGLYQQFLDIGTIVWMVRAGTSDADILKWAQKRSRDLLNTTTIIGRARMLIKEPYRSSASAHERRRSSGQVGVYGPTVHHTELLPNSIPSNALDGASSPAHSLTV